VKLRDLSCRPAFRRDPGRIDHTTRRFGLREQLFECRRWDDVAGPKAYGWKVAFPDDPVKGRSADPQHLGRFPNRVERRTWFPGFCRF
jgi:hypothetical protein